MAHHEVVLTGALDHDSLLYDAGLTDAVRESRLVPAVVFFDRGSGYARLFGGASYAGDVGGS
jgi:N-methylhydantoinase B